MALRPWRFRSWPAKYLSRSFGSRTDSREWKEEQIAIGQERIFGPQGNMPGDRQLRKKLEGRKLMRWYFPSKYNLQDFKNQDYFEMHQERFAPRVNHQSIKHVEETLEKILQNQEKLEEFFKNLKEEDFLSNPTIQDLYGCYRLVSQKNPIKFVPNEQVFQEHLPVKGLKALDISNIGSNEKLFDAPQLQSYMARRHRFIDPMFRRRRLKWLERQSAGSNKEWNVKHRLPFYGTHPDDQKQWPTNKAGLHVTWPSPYCWGRGRHSFTWSFHGTFEFFNGRILDHVGPQFHRRVQWKKEPQCVLRVSCWITHAHNKCFSALETHPEASRYTAAGCSAAEEKSGPWSSGTLCVGPWSSTHSTLQRRRLPSAMWGWATGILWGLQPGCVTLARRICHPATGKKTYPSDMNWNARMPFCLWFRRSKSFPAFPCAIVQLSNVKSFCLVPV